MPVDEGSATLCGFVGSLGPSGHPHATGMAERVWRMTTSLAHRGPDDSGLAGDERVQLGFHRLSIVDIAGGHQPMASEDGRYLIVCNGQIYNHVELREELERAGMCFRTRSDTEVVLALYRLAGRDLVHRLRGMFAFAIWDAARGELFAARDRFGVKPLYYAELAGQFWFASEKKVLLALPGTAEVDRDALANYLAFQYVPGTATVSTGIRELSPGGRLLVRPGQPPLVERWWRPTLRPAARPATGEGRRILDALRDSVRVHLNGEVPVGAFLSGGIDSTAVVALAREAKPDLETFTVGFERDGYSEIDLARRSAEALGVRHHAYVITAEEFASELPRIVWQLDDPVADPAAVPLWFLAREARRRVKVALSGEGADELFGGYRVYHQPWAVRSANRLPDPARRPLRALAARLPDGLAGKGVLLRAGTRLDERYLGNARIFSTPEIRELLGDPSAPGPEGAIAPLYAAARGLDDVATMQAIDLALWLPGDILVKADRMSMAYGLEVRVPFLDREVFHVAAGLSRASKIGRGTTKLALRRALVGVVPDDALVRPKLGFPVPIRHWLAGELHDWAGQIIDDGALGGLFDADTALELLRRHRAGDGDHSRKLWTLLVLCLWHQATQARRLDQAALVEPGAVTDRQRRDHAGFGSRPWTAAPTGA